MSRTLTPDSSLETLKKEAKRWLNALRAGDTQARRRLIAATPTAPANPGLRDVQLALAREYGFPGWIALRRALDDLALARRSHDERVEMVLRAAMWQGDRATAARILARWPEIATANIYAAAAIADRAEIERCLTTDPAAATRKGDPLDWEPLLYLAYARFSDQPQGLDAAPLLLDHGADPNARWIGPWGEPPFTVLTGVIGEGEGVRPPHPQARALATLLIDRGADPFDPQALYNTSIVGDDIAWLEFLWAQSERRRRIEAWRAVPETAIGGVVPLNAFDYLLGNAVASNHLQRVEWLLAHGANANSLHAYSKRPQREEAMIHGYEEVVVLLDRHGAMATPLAGKAAFRAACMKLDREVAHALVKLHPEILSDAEPMLTAARLGRVDIVTFLLELGVNVDVADEMEQRGLHNAVAGGALDVVKLLVAHGADIDRPTTRMGGGSLGFAAHFGRREIATFLAPLSRDVPNLTYLGMAERLRELFAVDPTLANAVYPKFDATPLFALPDDEEEAVEMAAVLLAHGADPQTRNKDGLTAEQAARKRGLIDAADLMSDGETV
jgi:uncharacterized protein